MYNIYFGSFLTNDWNHAFPSPCLGPSLLSSSELEVTCLEQLAAPAFPKLMESLNQVIQCFAIKTKIVFSSLLQCLGSGSNEQKYQPNTTKKNSKPKSELLKKS